MPFGRFFDADRKAQGFHSQAHLDDFYAYFDHTQTCAECQKPGRGVELDDCIQPTMNRCELARELDSRQWAHRHNAISAEPGEL